MGKLENELWRFETANFAVVLTAEQEDLDPADSFEFDEDIEAVRSGSVEWFCAKVAVYLLDDEGGQTELDADYLGGCAYKRFSDFYREHITYKSGGYFTDMVRTACAHARAELTKYQSIRVRKGAST